MHTWILSARSMFGTQSFEHPRFSPDSNSEQCLFFLSRGLAFGFFKDKERGPVGIKLPAFLFCHSTGSAAEHFCHGRGFHESTGRGLKWKNIEKSSANRLHFLRKEFSKGHSSHSHTPLYIDQHSPQLFFFSSLIILHSEVCPETRS